MLSMIIMLCTKDKIVGPWHIRVILCHVYSHLSAVLPWHFSHISISVVDHYNGLSCKTPWCYLEIFISQQLLVIINTFTFLVKSANVVNYLILSIKEMTLQLWPWRILMLLLVLIFWKLDSSWDVVWFGSEGSGMGSGLKSEGSDGSGISKQPAWDQN